MGQPFKKLFATMIFNLLRPVALASLLFMSFFAVTANASTGNDTVDSMCPCAGPTTGGAWKNHGEYVSCVAAAKKRLAKGGMPKQEIKSIVSDAAKSSCGSKKAVPPAPDTTDPELSIDTPADGDTVNDSIVVVSGTATDAGGIASVTVNGVGAILIGDMYSLDVQLVEGDNLVTVVAVDGSGNMSSASVEVLYDPAGSVSAVIGELGGELIFKIAGDPLEGTRLLVPPGALIEGEELTFYIKDDGLPPGSIPDNLVFVSPVVSLETNGRTRFDDYIEVTIPYSDERMSQDDMVSVFYWDNARSKYRAASVLSIDRVSKKVTFQTNHFTKFVGVSSPGLSSQLGSMSISTGFATLGDGFQIKNFITVPQPSGNCLTMSSYAAWYFIEKMPSQGSLRYRYPIDKERQLVCAAGENVKWWNSTTKFLKGFFVSDKDALLSVITAMQVTDEPQVLAFDMRKWYSGQIDSHAVVVGAYNSGQLAIYDSNFPEINNIAIDYSNSSGLSYDVYSSIRSWAHVSIATAVDEDEYEKINRRAERGDWSKNYCEGNTQPPKIIKVDFEGTVYYTGEPGSEVSPFDIGDRFWGSYDLNVNASDSRSESTYGRYDGAVSNLQINLDTYSPGSSGAYRLDIYNDPSWDIYSVRTEDTLTATSVGGWRAVSFVLFVQDYYATMFDSDAIPTRPPSIGGGSLSLHFVKSTTGERSQVIASLERHSVR